MTTRARKAIRARWILALVALAAACGGGGGLVTIFVPVEVSEQTIKGFAPQSAQGQCNPGVQGTGSLGPDGFQPLSINLKASKELEGQSFLRFTHVELKKITLTILIPPSQQGQTWDFVDSISIFADDPSTSDPPVLVAKLDPVPRGITQMVIPGTGVDISDIASADHFTVSGSANGRPPCADVHFNGQADFDVSIF